MELNHIHQLLSLIALRVMNHSEVHIQKVDLNAMINRTFTGERVDTHQVRMSVDDLRDTLARERLLPETDLDVVENLRVRRV